jgi:hypothetical protein
VPELLVGRGVGVGGLVDGLEQPPRARSMQAT